MQVAESEERDGYQRGYRRGFAEGKLAGRREERGALWLVALFVASLIIALYETVECKN